MERWREDFHEEGKIYQQDVFSWCFQGRLKLNDVIQVLKSHNTCTNQLADSIEFGYLSPICCIGSSKQSIKNLLIYVVSLSTVFYTVLICVSLTNWIGLCKFWFSSIFWFSTQVRGTVSLVRVFRLTFRFLWLCCNL